MLYQQCGLHFRRDGLSWHSSGSPFQLWPKWLQIWKGLQANCQKPEGRAGPDHRAGDHQLCMPQGGCRVNPCGHCPMSFSGTWGKRPSVCSWSHSWEDRMRSRWSCGLEGGQEGQDANAATSVLENMWVTVPREKKRHPWKPGASQNYVGKLHIAGMR